MSTSFYPHRALFPENLKFFPLSPKKDGIRAASFPLPRFFPVPRTRGAAEHCEAVNLCVSTNFSKYRAS